MSDEQEAGQDRAPEVSVAIPAYRAAEFIAETLESVFAQTFRDFETIVVNDGSPDTPALEAALAPYRSRIVYLVQPNRGVSAARNAAIRRAAGRYVAFLDADDLWAPDYLATQIAALNRDADLDFVCADSTIFGRTHLTGHTYLELWPLNGPLTVEKMITEKCLMSTSCIVAKRERVIEAGMFDEELRFGEDLDLLVRLALRGKVLYQPAVIGARRITDLGLTGGGDGIWQGREGIKALTKIRRLPDLPPELAELLEGEIRRRTEAVRLLEGKHHLMRGEYERAAEAYRRAATIKTRRKTRLVLAGLSLAPGLTRHGVQIWSRMLRAASRRGLWRRRGEPVAERL